MSIIPKRDRKADVVEQAQKADKPQQTTDKKKALADALNKKKVKAKKKLPPKEVRMQAPDPSVTTANYSYEDIRKFHCTGRIRDRQNNASGVTFWLRNELKEEVEKWCSGQQTIYMNQLIELGLEVVKGWDSPVDYCENAERERREKELAKKALIEEMRQNGELPPE